MQIIARTVLLALFSVTALFCFREKQTNNSLKAVVTEIANSDIYEGYTVGIAATVSKQYQRFKQLLSLATEQQLTDMAVQNKNAVVRLYAFQALKQKRANISEALLEQFQNDKTIVMTLNGCIGGKKTVSELAKQSLRSAYDLTNK